MSPRRIRVVSLLGLLAFFDSDADEQVRLRLDDLPCDSGREARWFVVREQLVTRLPSYIGRTPFGAFNADIDMFESLDREIDSLGVNAIIFSLTKMEPPSQWSVCSLGAITIRAFSLLVQVSVKKTELWQFASEYAALVLIAPWRDILLNGWPIFDILAALSRWASPHGADHGKSSIRPSPLHIGTQIAKEMPNSQCDKKETGAIAQVRQLLSHAWRSRDPASPALANDQYGRETLAETQLAGLENEPEPDSKGEECTWTEHRDTLLGGIMEAHLDGIVDLRAAMEVCNLEPACAGITLEPVSDGMTISLRKGDPFLEPSSIGEISYVKWCKLTSADAYAKDGLNTFCPLSRSVGLLATLLRRLKSSMLDFSPELLAEAQGSLTTWCLAVGEGIAGREAWATEWPLWDILGRLQQRVNLFRSVSSHNPTPITATLQGALGFDDDAWRLAMSKLDDLATTHGSRAVPAAARSGIRCADGNQCVAELYARLHLLLTHSGHLPLRDQIYLAPGDSLSRLFRERGKELSEGMEDDWDIMLQPPDGRATDQETRSKELDKFMPSGHPLQVDRRQLANFIYEVRPLIGEKPLGRCLEWDQPFLLLRAFQKVCRWNDVFSYSEPDPDEPMMGMPGRHEYTYGTRHYWGDLLSPDGLGIEPDTFDLILIPFVFEHVAQPFVGMKNIAFVLRSGGYVIWAAPMFQQYHGSPHDYFRYTPKGARALAESAGLEVVRLHAPGTLSLVTGVMSGMLLPYWTDEQISLEDDPKKDEDSPGHPLNIFMLLRKPPRKSA